MKEFLILIATLASAAFGFLQYWETKKNTQFDIKSIAEVGIKDTIPTKSLLSNPSGVAIRPEKSTVGIENAPNRSIKFISIKAQCIHTYIRINNEEIHLNAQSDSGRYVEFQYIEVN